MNGAILPIVIGVGLFSLLIGGTMWHAGEVNKEHVANTWYQEGVVMERTSTWHGITVIVEAEDEKRYLEYCSKCLVGDRVEIQMLKQRSIEVESILND